MALLAWDPKRFSVDVPTFDQQHQKLFDLVNKLHDAMRAGKGKDALAAVLSELIVYTKTHFADEERLMVQRNYADYARHKYEHDKLAAQVALLQSDFASGKAVLTMDVMTFLQDWLTNHILISDKAYVAHLGSAAKRATA